MTAFSGSYPFARLWRASSRREKRISILAHRYRSLRVRFVQTRKARLFGRLAPRLTELLRYEASVSHRKSVGCRMLRTTFRSRRGVTLRRPLTLRPLPRTCLSIRKSRGFASNPAERGVCAEGLFSAANSAERGVCAQGREEVPRAYALPSTHLIYPARKRGHLMKAVT